MFNMSGITLAVKTTGCLVANKDEGGRCRSEYKQTQIRLSNQTSIVGKILFGCNRNNDNVGDGGCEMLPENIFRMCGSRNPNDRIPHR